MGKHSFLSASASHRWINCPPSARLCEEYADKPSEYAQEGTDCHELCAYKVEKALGRRVKDPTENLTYYSQEMEDCADGYCAFVMEEVAKARERCADPLVLVEQRLDYSRYVGIEGSFGTGDCVIVSDGLLHIIDYKHGLGVLVSAEKNSQLSCYALGALDLFDGIYDIAQVSLTIYQPRRENVSTYTMSREELLSWAETVLAPAAKLAYEGKGEFKAGDHCQFCKAKVNCRKRAEYNLELAQYDFEMPALLGDDEVAAILTKADELVSWAGDIKDYALQKALSGTKFTGFKVVEGRSNRKYTDEAAVAKAVEDAGYEPYEKRLLGITAMSQTLGRKKFEELLGGLVYKPPGKPVLVPESDKRPAMNTAINDFKEMRRTTTMAKIVNKTKVITGPRTRWSYANVWDPKSINGGTPKYSVSLIIPKSDKKTVEAIKAAIQAAYEEGESKLKGNGKTVPALSVIKTPLRDGDVERPDDPVYADAYFINANSATAPGIVDADLNPILERSEVYSGVYGRASINLYAFNSNGNRGIACGLNNLQKISDGEPLGGKSRAEDDFSTEDDDDYLS
jgi:hypothetical protein